MILLVMANDEVLASTTKDSHGAMRDNTNPVYIHRPMMPRPIVHKLSSHEFFEVSVLNVYSDFLGGVYRYLSALLAIRHLHISSNTPSLPPPILHNLHFSFLLGITVSPREDEGNAYANLEGKQGVL